LIGAFVVLSVCVTVAVYKFKTAAKAKQTKKEEEAALADETKDDEFKLTQ